MVDELDDLLDSYNFNVLAVLADRAGLKTKDARGKKLRKADLVPLIRRDFFTAQRARAEVDRLSDLDREVLDRILLHGGEVSADLLRQELTQEGMVTDQQAAANRYGYGRRSGSPYTGNSPKFEDVVARLTLAGLVFGRGLYAGYGAQAKIGWEGGSILFIPAPIRSAMPEPKMPALELSEAEAGEPHEAPPDAFLSDLFIYWNDLRWNQVPFIKAGTVGKRDLRRINESLMSPDPTLDAASREDGTGRLYFLRLMLQDLGLARREGDRLVADETALFWAQAPAEQFKTCLRTWQSSTTWSDVSANPGLTPLASQVNQPQGRQAIMDLLRQQPPDTWLAVGQLMRRLSLANATFLYPQRQELLQPKTTYSYSSYYGYGSSYYGDPAAVLKQILEIEAAFVDRVLRGPLHWLGLIDLGRQAAQSRGQSPRLVAVRLTPVGAVALGLAQAVLPDTLAAAEAQLIVQPNFQMFALGPLAPDVLAGVETFADRVKAGRGAFEYTLTRQSIYRAQQAGQSVADILRFLEDYASTDIPQNVRRTLEDWGALHERIVLRDRVALCQVADPALLDELLADETTRAGFAYRAAPHTAIIADGQQAGVLQALLDRGLLPTHSTDDPQRDVAGIVADEHGRICFAHAVPSLHLEGRLARLAERTPAGEYAITRQSVRQALHGAFADVPALLRELDTLHRGPVPHRLVIRIKAWAHYYGNAAMQPLVLLQVSSADTLRELLDDPDLADLIAAFRPAPGLALAVADAARLDELRARLDERGIALTDRLKA